MKKILIVGQTPPPYGGQAVMIDYLLKGKYKSVKLFHARMKFSKEMNEVGKASLFKVFHLLRLILQIIYMRFRFRIPILYFPPTGPNMVPFYRDAAVLVCVRPFFRKTMFHFHAAGISELYPKLNSFSKLLFRRAYGEPEIGIRLSEFSINDSAILNVKREFIIPYGIPDNLLPLGKPRLEKSNCNVLFVGLLNESKGIEILVEASGILRQKGCDFNVTVLGKFESNDFEQKVRGRVSSLQLDKTITFLGVKSGQEKFEVYAQADIFCFPTYFEAESFPVVLLEALSFGLPVVSTKWRGIPTMVRDNENGMLTDIKNPHATAEKLEMLIKDATLRTRLGKNGRDLYAKNFSIEKFHENLEKVFNLV